MKCLFSPHVSPMAPLAVWSCSALVWTNHILRPFIFIFSQLHSVNQLQGTTGLCRIRKKKSRPVWVRHDSACTQVHPAASSVDLNLKWPVQNDQWKKSPQWKLEFRKRNGLKNIIHPHTWKRIMMPWFTPVQLVHCPSQGWQHTLRHNNQHKCTYRRPPRPIAPPPPQAPAIPHILHANPQRNAIPESSSKCNVFFPGPFSTGPCDPGDGNQTAMKHEVKTAAYWDSCFLTSHVEYCWLTLNDLCLLENLLGGPLRFVFESARFKQICVSRDLFPDNLSDIYPLPQPQYLAWIIHEGNQ